MGPTMLGRLEAPHPGAVLGYAHAGNGQLAQLADGSAEHFRADGELYPSLTISKCRGPWNWNWN